MVLPSTMENEITTYDIASGDLLLWTSYPENNISNFLIKSIAKLTNSPFGHVGIAWKSHDTLDDELFVVEASIPRITITRATEDSGMYCIPMHASWLPKNKRFLTDLVGKPYSIVDAIRGYLGMVAKKDDRYQCVELARDFYEVSGIKIPCKLTPGGIYDTLINQMGKELYRVI